MPCYHPLRAFRPPADSGSAKLIFSKIELAHLQPVKVSCGQCIGCRLERSRQWAVRCVHEASLYERNSFITLTFAPKDLPKSGSLNKRDFQLFMKRLRKRFGSGVRYFHCGEYGEKNKRPHYHACLFNFDFPDRVLWSTRRGVRLYTSQALQELWPFGFSTVGDVTFESAAYVARYITKKVTGEKAVDHYGVSDWVTSTPHMYAKPRSKPVYVLQPEYITMSRRPGIGRGWFDKYKSDVYPHDRVVLTKGAFSQKAGVMVTRPPKYYDSIFELDNPEIMEEIKFRRYQSRLNNSAECTPARLAMRERHQLIRFEKLKRGYEYG